MPHLYKLDLPFCYQATNIPLTDSERLRYRFNVDQLRNPELAGSTFVCHCLLLPVLGDVSGMSL
jgi:hypothetical protein